jgi:hypothetical protein
VSKDSDAGQSNQRQKIVTFREKSTVMHIFKDVSGTVIVWRVLQAKPLESSPCHSRVFAVGQRELIFGKIGQRSPGKEQRQCFNFAAVRGFKLGLERPRWEEPLCNFKFSLVVE